MDLEQALIKLGNTHDEVAATLLAGGFKGKKTSSCDCPVARYLCATLDDGNVYRVERWEVFSDNGEDTTMPKAVCDFVFWFDKGAYPDLILSES
jgi:hypothetical protein